MNLAIITQPLHANYGGLLQAYALQTVLERKGHTVEVIEKRRKEPSSLYIFVLAPVYRLLRHLCKPHNEPTFFEYYERRMFRHTRRFVKNYIHQRFITEFSTATTSMYDGIVVGSDQVWRRAYNEGMFYNVFLCFTQERQMKRVAYAASFGVDYWEYTPAETQVFREAISRFDAVSVREDSGVTLCREYLGAEARQVLDPTLLLERSDYVRLVERARTTPSAGNLMSYVLDTNPEMEAFIADTASQKSLVPFRTNYAYDSSLSIKHQQQPPVEQWLRGFMDAEFVITDSFHACVFSILFGKPFVVVGNKTRGMARFHSLLKMFGLEGHLITDLSQYNPQEDYHIPAEVYTRLDALRREANDFLREALK